mgnify:CR=1 FL=1
MNTEDLKNQPRPSFKNPPLIEVVAGVQFEHPLNLRTLDFADIWTTFDREKFPKYREMPPLKPMLPDNVHMIDMSDLPPMRRFWFETEKQDALIQTQQDRLIYNWKRPPANFDDKNCYPRYDLVIEDFFKHYDTFINLLKEKEVTNAKPSFLELSYINLIDIPENGLSDIKQIFKDIDWFSDSRILPVPDSIQHRWFFQVPDLPLRLVADLSTRQRIHDGQIALQYELSVRGPINKSSSEDMREWFDNAHLWITHGFIDTTSEYIHKKWEREA